MTKEDLRDYFDSHKCMNASCIEKEAEIPYRSLSHFLNGSRKSIPQSSIDKIEKLLKSYGYTATASGEVGAKKRLKR